MNLLGGESYDDQSKEYAAFADESFSWRYIERPAMDEYLAGYYGQDVNVLDIGCGNGRIIEHLVDRGIAAENITGLDPSPNMLDIAAMALPQEVSLVPGKAAEMPFTDESFNLVVANMVLHAMDDRELDATVGKISDVLVPGGEFLFIDSNPREDEEHNFLKRWIARQTPWGTTIRVFNHDMTELLERVAPSHGLECVRSGPLEVAPEGETDDPAEYARYSLGQFRIAALLRKSVD
ncbi:MAG TPA: class I SAM-dependent methyltransferase [Candidatus Saccharimonadales bacterium]|nr:class I SAM-dependent methyltransferase [Candidatus Saccharimonadales bacterium]